MFHLVLLLLAHVLFGAKHLDSSIIHHQPKSTQEKLLDLHQFLQNPPPSGIPICHPTAFEPLRLFYGAAFVPLSILLNSCQPVHPALAQRLLSGKDTQIVQQQIIDGLYLLYHQTESSPYIQEAKYIVQSLAHQSDPLSWAIHFLAPLWRPSHPPEERIAPPNTHHSRASRLSPETKQNPQNTFTIDKIMESSEDSPDTHWNNKVWENFRSYAEPL